MCCLDCLPPSANSGGNWFIISRMGVQIQRYWFVEGYSRTTEVLKIDHLRLGTVKIQNVTALDLCVTVVCLDSDKSKHSMIEVISK